MIPSLCTARTAWARSRRKAPAGGSRDELFPIPLRIKDPPCLRAPGVQRRMRRTIPATMDTVHTGTRRSYLRAFKPPWSPPPPLPSCRTRAWSFMQMMETRSTLLRRNDTFVGKPMFIIVTHLISSESTCGYTYVCYGVGLFKLPRVSPKNNRMPATVFNILNYGRARVSDCGILPYFRGPKVRGCREFFSVFFLGFVLGFFQPPTLNIGPIRHDLDTRIVIGSANSSAAAAQRRNFIGTKRIRCERGRSNKRKISSARRAQLNAELVRGRGEKKYTG